VLSLLMRRISPSLAPWIVVAVASIRGGDACAPLRPVAPGIYLGVVSVLADQRVSALTDLLAVAPMLCSIALARSRSIRLDQRRGETKLVEAMARLLLRTDDPRSTLPGVSGRVLRAIELEAAAGEKRRVAFALRECGALVVPIRVRAVAGCRIGTRAERHRERMMSAVER
jgi:hypothetical protein